MKKLWPCKLSAYTDFPWVTYWSQNCTDNAGGDDEQQVVNLAGEILLFILNYHLLRSCAEVLTTRQSETGEKGTTGYREKTITGD